MKTYYIKQKICLNDKYCIYNVNNEPYLEVVSDNKLLTMIDRLLGGIFTFGNKIYIKNLYGEEIVIIKKKFGFFKDEYDFYSGKNIIASFKQYVVSIKPKISIITNHDNYLIEGDLMAGSFTFLKNNIEIAKVEKVLFDIKDSYKIDIFEEKDEILCLSMLIAIDNSMHN